MSQIEFRVMTVPLQKIPTRYNIFSNDEDGKDYDSDCNYTSIVDICLCL